jgi:predicted urease superfamily metal-dependent hydrolase
MNTPIVEPVAIIELGIYGSEKLVSKAVRDGGKFQLEFSKISDIDKPGTVIAVRSLVEARQVFKDLRGGHDMAEVREFRSEDSNDYKIHFSGWL